MPAPIDNEIGVIVGQKGLGKTTLARYLCQQMPRRLVLDSLGTDYGGGCVVRSGKDLVEYWNRVQHYAEFSIIARPNRDDRLLPAAVFRLAARARDLWLVVEEADKYCGPHQIHPDFQDIINYCRQTNVSVCAMARRAARVNRDLTANADWIVAHRTVEPIDLDYLREFMDTSQLPSLDRFQWVRWGESRLAFPA